MALHRPLVCCISGSKTLTAIAIYLYFYLYMGQAKSLWQFYPPIIVAECQVGDCYRDRTIALCHFALIITMINTVFA